MGVDYKLVDVELGDDYSYPQFKYMETSCITIKKKIACVKEKFAPFPLQEFMVRPLTKRNEE